MPGMGADTGGMGDASPSQKVDGDVPPEIKIFSDFFLELTKIVRFFQDSQNKLTEIRGEIRI